MNTSHKKPRAMVVKKLEEIRPVIKIAKRGNIRKIIKFIITLIFIMNIKK